MAAITPRRVAAVYANSTYSVSLCVPLTCTMLDVDYLSETLPHAYYQWRGLVLLDTDGKPIRLDTFKTVAVNFAGMQFSWCPRAIPAPHPFMLPVQYSSCPVRGPVPIRILAEHESAISPAAAEFVFDTVTWCPFFSRVWVTRTVCMEDAHGIEGVALPDGVVVKSITFQPGFTGTIWIKTGGKTVTRVSLYDNDTTLTFSEKHFEGLPTCVNARVYWESSLCRSVYVTFCEMYVDVPYPFSGYEDENIS